MRAVRLSYVEPVPHVRAAIRAAREKEQEVSPMAVAMLTAALGSHRRHLDLPAIG
ncbi:hypothetical protein ACIGXM_16700 [Kitasatospora sp. NPDC052896]|uniref:hypothetical protein n=1 Tax=Kitasatospora sp. NPDC052896 TaxID=3364061 RepID=UPI0037C5D2CF